MNIFVVDDRFALPISEQVPPGLTSLSAEECGGCHEEIYAEWATSMHAHAWRDPYFQVDYRFDGSQQICLNCHTPLRDQQENLVLGFEDSTRFKPVTKPNPNFDPLFRSEGVTCAVCHVRDGQIIGPYERAGDHFHPVRADASMRQGLGPCERCHVVSGKRWDTFLRIPPCGTVAEIEETGAKPDCVGCHMEPVTRPLVKGYPERDGRRHFFPGGHSREMVAKALTVTVKQTVKDDGQRVEVSLTNSGAGHYLPTGTPDRHLTLELTLLGTDARTIRRKVYTMKRTILWRPFIVDLFDTRLPHGSSRVVNFEVTPREMKDASLLDVRVRYHLLDERRRRRIGYAITTPIAYPVYEQRIALRPSP